MIKNNLELLDMDEHLRPKMTTAYAEIISYAQKLGLIVDCATSDVVTYLKDQYGNSVCIG